MKHARYIIVAGLVAVLIVFGIWRWLTGSGEEAVRTVTADRQTVVQDVAFTGNVEAEQTADLGFEVLGTVTAVLVNEGDQVQAGQALVRLDTTAVDFELAKAIADRASARDELRIAQEKAAADYDLIKTENARTLEQRRQAVRDAKAELDHEQEVWQQKVRESGDESSTARSAYALVLAAESKYHAAQEALEVALATAAKSNKSAEQAAALAKERFEATLQASGQVAGLSAVAALEQAARASVGKYTLTAPFAGMVTLVDIETGEFVSAGKRAVTVQSGGNLKLVARVPETDAVKIVPGSMAEVTFDALPPTEQFVASVSSVAPAAAFIEGVPTFKIELTLDHQDERLRPGLTANITVAAAKHEQVVAVPRRAVTVRDAKQYVRVLRNDGSVVEVEVTTGLLGSEGLIEIVSGLGEGDRVVVGSVEN